ncbi:MAG: polysaccharide lyase [Adhaeribacter sp.]
MFKKIIPFIALTFVGAITTSCDQNELDEVATENVTATENATSANILIEETFEGSTYFNGFNGTEFGTSHAFAAVTSPVYDGKKAGRFELRDSDPEESNGTRAEMSVIKDKVQKEMWYSFAVYLPSADFAYDSKKEILSQWHQSGGTSPPSYLLIQKDRWSYEVANKMDSHVKFDLGAVAKDVWNQFTFHYITSNGSDGLVEIWHNGTKVLTHKGGNMYNLSNLPKWKLGVYKWDWNGSGTTDVKKRVLFYDNVRVGTANATLAEMSARGTTTTVPTTPPTTTEPTTPPTTTEPTTPPTGSTETTVPTTPTTGGTTTTGAMKLTFINAEVDKEVKELINGGSLSLSALGSQKVSIRAYPTTSAASVKFALTGSKNYTYVDNASPFAIFGDNGSGNYYYGTYIPVGSYTLTVTPYSGAKGTGTAGTPTVVKFTITK